MASVGGALEVEPPPADTDLPERIGKTNGIFARRSKVRLLESPSSNRQRWTRAAGWGRVGPTRSGAGGAAGKGRQQRVGYTRQSVMYLYDTGGPEAATDVRRDNEGSLH